MQPFELIKSEVILQGRAFKIRHDLLRTPDGRKTQFDIVEHGGSVIILPMDAEGGLIFVRQYRHAAGTMLLELPAGTRSGEEPYDVCAAREIREETGFAADNLLKVGEFFLAPGYSTEFMVVFLATGLKADPLPADDDEFIEIERIPVNQAYRMAERGDIPDAKSLAALLTARPALAKYL